MIFSTAEKKYLKGDRPVSSGYNSVLKSRIRKKTSDALNDVKLVCSKLNDISPKTETNRKEFLDKMQGLCEGLEQ